MGTTPDVPTDVAVHPDGLERHWQIAGFRRPRDLAVGYRGTHALQCRIQYHGVQPIPGMARRLVGNADLGFRGTIGQAHDPA
ncbi:Uncharacterised protein [Mycobacterium tuberculosis]|uniref:Uncharacterized protein n=1 Tax=Mycobacterium tuberculosis TaxID=1773 RepID=A0A0T9YIV5_MYCTX|nr:Uncharacterised protein [Mycobacterium tuberculosis]CFE64503.1 Uncharacterised protein [Mycobacterium tuberculosis]CKR24388.1 Uncharacterised protein [Mycobacterium tuberculosis]CKR39417.1 Uncharacterised protein [Mycobacterium tuberculosis]CKS80949.1 Uncharacterised protein [Mycobacterium tuberculosis]